MTDVHAKNRYLVAKKDYLSLKKLHLRDDGYPFQDYYACSSHNTYLVEHKHKKGINGKLKSALNSTLMRADQLTGKASDEQYINVLMEGCRHVELDVYDGRKSDTKFEPIITHGGTLVNCVTLRDVLRRITEFTLYKRGKFSPIILNIENNCTNKKTSTLSGCQAVSSVVQEVWDDNTNFKPDPCMCEDRSTYLMSKYMNKILIRDSEKKHYVDSTDDMTDSGSDNRSLRSSSSSISYQDIDDLENYASDHIEKDNSNLNKSMSVSWANNLNSEEYTDDTVCARDSFEYRRYDSFVSKPTQVNLKKMPHVDQKALKLFDPKCSDFFSDLCGCYTKSINFSHLRCNLQLRNIKNKKVIDKNAINCFIKKTKLITTRTYPPGMHVTSINYDPIICMSLGINYAAINFQMNDRYKAVYMALFSNSNGYILKPRHLRSLIDISNVFEDLEYKTITLRPTDKTTRYCSLFTGFLTYSTQGACRSKAFNEKQPLKLKICNRELEISVIYIYDQKGYYCLPLNQLIESITSGSLNRSTMIRLRMLTHKPKRVEYNNVADANIESNKKTDSVYPKVSKDFKYYYLKHIVPNRYIDLIISIY